MYALVLVPSVLLMLVAAATASSSSELSATLSTIDDLLNIPMFLFILLFGIWDSKRVCRATGTRGWLTALAVLVAVVYLFVRQSKARQTQLPAFTFLGMGLAYGAFVFAAMASSFGGASGHVTCTDLVSESIRISEEIYKGSDTPLLVGVRDVTLILDNQGNAIPPRSGEADALVCRGTGTFSDSSVSNVSMTYSVDSGGNGFISYQPE